MKPYMTQAETAAFTRYRDKSRNYFEFGCGGSTVFCDSPQRRIKSVDNHQEWLNKVRPLVGATTELIYVTSREGGLLRKITAIPLQYFINIQAGSKIISFITIPR